MVPDLQEVLNAAEIAEDSVDKNAVRKLLTAKTRSLAEAPIGTTGPWRWWLAFGECTIQVSKSEEY